MLSFLFCDAALLLTLAVELFFLHILFSRRLSAFWLCSGRSSEALQITRGQRHYGVTMNVADISISYDHTLALTAASKGKPKHHVQKMLSGGLDLANLCTIAKCDWVAIAPRDRETQQSGNNPHLEVQLLLSLHKQIFIQGGETLLLCRISPKKGQTCRPGVAQLVPACLLLLKLVGTIACTCTQCRAVTSIQAYQTPRNPQKLWKIFESTKVKIIQDMQLAYYWRTGDFKKKKGNEREIEDRSYVRRQTVIFRSCKRVSYSWLAKATLFRKVHQRQCRTSVNTHPRSINSCWSSCSWFCRKRDSM